MIHQQEKHSLVYRDDRIISVFLFSIYCIQGANAFSIHSRVSLLIPVSLKESLLVVYLDSHYKSDKLSALYLPG
jgi:hypothetical protein